MVYEISARSDLEAISRNQYGKHLRYFTNEEEAAIAAFIRENFIKQGYIFANLELQKIARHAYLERHSLITYVSEEKNYEDIQLTEEEDDEYDMKAMQNVLMGSRFIANFKKRNHFSSRRTRVERRSASTPEIIAVWEKQMQDLFNSKIPWDHIVNCNETSWKVFPNGLLTWTDTSSDNIQTIVQGNTKEIEMKKLKNMPKTLESKCISCQLVLLINFNR